MKSSIIACAVMFVTVYISSTQAFYNHSNLCSIHPHKRSCIDDCKCRWCFDGNSTSHYCFDKIMEVCTNHTSHNDRCDQVNYLPVIAFIITILSLPICFSLVVSVILCNKAFRKFVCVYCKSRKIDENERLWDDQIFM